MAETKLFYTEHDSMLIRSFATFFEKEDYLDVIFVCKDGKKLLANKLLLSCLSPFLKSLLSEHQGNQEMITLLLPEVDHNILKLVFDFVYEGVTKLSESEYRDFRQILEMLEIKLPGASVTERNAQSAPQNPPPPAAKLQKKKIKEKLDDSTENSETDTRDNSGAVENTPSKRGDPDDDPLNVPDYYYVQSSITRRTDANDQRRSDQQQDIATNMKEIQQTNDGSTVQQAGKRKRTGLQKNLENRSDAPKAKKKPGRKSAAQGSADSSRAKKRNQPHASSPNVSPEKQQKKKIAKKKQLKQDDSMNPPRTKIKKT